MSLLGKIIRGSFGMPKMLWLFCVLPYVAFSILFIIFSRNSSPLILLVIFLVYFVYAILALIGLWRSSLCYSGPRVWSLMVQILLLLVVLQLSRGVFHLVSMRIKGISTNSRTIVRKLQPDKDYPFIGFWKTDCTKNFGWVIDKVGDGYYSDSFCGPGGCFDKGTYRKNTKLIGDPNYKIIDNDTIQVKRRDSSWSIIHRCE